MLVEISRLVSFAHLSMPAEERYQLAIDYVIRSMDIKPLRRHLLTADTTALTIKGYLSVKNTYDPACWMVGEQDQLRQLARTLTVEIELLTKTMVRLEA